MGFVMPIRCTQPDSMPVERLATKQLVQGHVDSFDRQMPVQSQLDKHPGKAVNVRVFFEQSPVEPGNLVVLAESVVVPALAPPYLISHEQHRRTDRQQCQCQEV